MGVYNRKIGYFAIDFENQEWFYVKIKAIDVNIAL